MITDKLILETDKLIYEKEMIAKKLIEAEKAKTKAEKDKKKAKENTLHEVAKNMLDAGMPFEQIENITKLPLEKIKELQTQKLN